MEEPREQMEVRVTKSTISQRGGKSPDIEVTRTQYIPARAVILNLDPPQPQKPRTKKAMRGQQGVTRKEFHRLLDKASQPINESDQGQSQT